VPPGIVQAFYRTRLESVQEAYQELRSFRNISRMDASRRKASALRLRFSKSLARRRQRLSQAMVRLNYPAFWKNHKPFGLIGTFDDFRLEVRKDLRKIGIKERPLIGVGKQFL
jgi:hypothetical protein